MHLRPTQEAILDYSGGRMAVAAVPGSGKTFTLTRLAAHLIADGRINSEQNQQVLIVTYLNASVDNFKARIQSRLQELGRNPAAGYDVRTLHSLGLEIVRLVAGGERGNELIVLDEGQSRRFLIRAIESWIDAYPHTWAGFLPEASPQAEARWRSTVEKTALAFIRTAKNERYTPEAIATRLGALPPGVDGADGAENPLGRLHRPFLEMLTGIYATYQGIIVRQGALDFNDLIGQAADLVSNRQDLAAHLRQRWPFVLEDEAQDSVPLQEILLSGLTGEAGNWVRVGDPNQAITSTFTAAHPRFFNAFLDRPDVQTRPLPHSGRSAPKIIEAANRLVHWACDSHPVPEVRAHAFRRQDILPTPPGDSQPNPGDREARIAIQVYGHREEEEVPHIAQLATLFTQKRPDQTLAILVPTNDVGHKVAEQLDQLGASYDNLLRGGTREREIASALWAVLALMADPLQGRVLREAYLALNEIDHPAAGAPEERLDHLEVLLRSVVRVEKLLYPADRDDILAALPQGVATPDDFEVLGRFITFLQRVFPLRLLPVDDLIIALSDELFSYSDKDVNETDLAIAYQIANVLRSWYDLNPDWRLPELVGELREIAQGRRALNVLSAEEGGYRPLPGRITLNTQHGAKGLEWDGVFLMGVDGLWIPGTLESYFLGVDDTLGGDPAAEMTAELETVMTGGSTRHPGRTATESAHIEVICERLRLLYVGITRARRFLHLSRSRKTRTFRKEYDAEPATAMAVLYRFIKEEL